MCGTRGQKPRLHMFHRLLTCRGRHTHPVCGIVVGCSFIFKIATHVMMLDADGDDDAGDGGDCDAGDADDGAIVRNWDCRTL